MHLMVRVIVAPLVLAILALLSARGAGLADATFTQPQPCTTPLPPLTSQPLTQLAFQVADAGLATTIELAQAGDVARAEEVFLGAVHDLTHDIDAPLRQADEPLAVSLCQEVVTLERELHGSRDPAVVAEQAGKIRELLINASAALKPSIGVQQQGVCDVDESRLGSPGDIFKNIQMHFGEQPTDSGYDPSADLFQPGARINVNDLVAALNLSCEDGGESFWSSPLFFTAIIVAAILLLAAGGWYARRRLR